MFDRELAVRVIKAELRLGICDEKIRLARYSELSETDWLSLLQEAYAEFKAEGYTYEPRNCVKTLATCPLLS